MHPATMFRRPGWFWQGHLAAWTFLVSAMAACLVEGRAAGPDAAPGAYVLTGEDGRVSLHAQDAPLDDICRQLEAALGIRLRVAGGTDHLVTCAFESVGLDRLLSGLGLNHILYYEQDRDSGLLRLTHGGLAGRGVTTGDPELDRVIADHIENLRDDAIAMNANTNYSALRQLGAVTIPALENGL